LQFFFEVSEYGLLQLFSIKNSWFQGFALKINFERLELAQGLA